MSRSRPPKTIRVASVLVSVGAAFALGFAVLALVSLVFGSSEDAAPGLYGGRVAVDGTSGVLVMLGAVVVLAVLAAFQVLVAMRLDLGGSPGWWVAGLVTVALPAVQNVLGHVFAGERLSITWIVVPALGVICLLSPSARSHVRRPTQLP